MTTERPARPVPPPNRDVYDSGFPPVGGAAFVLIVVLALTLWLA